MKTVIFGCGYIGMALMQFWSGQMEQTVIGTTTCQEKQEKLQAQGFEATVADSSNPLDVAKVVEMADTLVVCIAAKTRGSYQQAYLTTAKNIYDQLKKGAHLKRLIYLSSTSVYGEQNGKQVTETSELNPQSENSQILIETEDLYLTKIARLARVSVLRLSGIYGPGRTYGQRVQFLSKHEPLKGANNFINAVHQEDIVRAIEWVITHELTGLYNVCCDKHLTKRELYNQVTKREGLPPLNWDMSNPISADNKKVVSDKLKATGFTFAHRCEGPEAWVNPLD